MSNNTTQRSIITLLSFYDEPRIILLIGICIKRIKKPINPINKNPIDVAIANFLNSIF